MLALLAVGLGLRLVTLAGTLDKPLLIGDEQHYHLLATSLLHGHGFAWGPGHLTSMRPPLYPAFVAAVWWLTGADGLQIVRLAQILLSLVNGVVVYLLARALFGEGVAVLATAGFVFYPSLIAYDFLVLTETLFTLLLSVFVLTTVTLLRTGRPTAALAAGIGLGLAALTRSILWTFPLILCPLIYASTSGTRRRRLALAALVLIGYVLTIGPWAVRNTRLQRTLTVVDTHGGVALRMGNYEHTPLDRPWDAVALSGEQSWSHGLRDKNPGRSPWTEGEREKLATREALAYALSHPGLTLHRTLLKLADFWGLERDLIAGFQRGYYRPGPVLESLGALAITLSYVALMLLASLGVFLSPPHDTRAHALILLLIAFVAGLHALAFGHSRYHIPLVPLLLLYGASALQERAWRHVVDGWRPVAGLLVCATLLLSIWAREVLSRDADRIRDLLRHWLGAP